MLLEGGADVNGAGADGDLETPLSMSLSEPDDAMSLLLLEHGADWGPNGGIYPLFEAAHYGSVRVFERLLELGADPHHEGKSVLNYTRGMMSKCVGWDEHYMVAMVKEWDRRREATALALVGHGLGRDLFSRIHGTT